MSVTDSTLTTQCLDFCQALAGQGKVFKFSITIDSTFTFSLDTREGKETFPTRIKKRSSPSTIRRNAKRREEYLKRSPSEAATATGLETIQKQCNAFQCDHCDSTFKTETHQCQNDQDLTQHIIKIYYYYHTSCICLTLLHCVFSNESSNRLFGRMQNHIGCICLTFLHCCDFK